MNGTRRAPMRDPRDDVTMVADRHTGEHGSAETRRKLRAVLRFGSDDGDEAPAGNDAEWLTVENSTTTQVTNYVAGLTKVFGLPEGEWRLTIDPQFQVKHTAGAAVEWEILLDGNQVAEDASGALTAGEWSTEGRPFTYDEEVDGDVHTIKINYRGDTAGTSAMRRGVIRLSWEKVS